MHQVRHIVQLLVVLTCLFVGGYQMSAQATALALSKLPDPLTATFSDAELSQLYPDLPTAVAKAIPSVVATQQVLDPATGRGIVASGVILNDNQILTAGHNVEGSGQIVCSQTKVAAVGASSKVAASQDPVSYASVRYGEGTDLAVLTVEASDNFKQLPDITIARRLPQKGDSLYFINYQPTADGSVRNPASASSNDPARDYSKPAVFGGRYLGEHDGGMSIATGYGMSYGLGAADIMARKGASGGAIVNANGELVGLTISSESLGANRTAASIAREYGVRMADQNYQIAHMQHVTKTSINSLQKNTVTCN